LAASGPITGPAGTGDGVARSAGLAGIATLTSRVLGLARDQVLASIFGAGNEMDAFVVAFRLPNLVRDLFAEGAMSAAFVPTFTRELTLGGKPTAWRLGNQIITALLAITGLLVITAIVFAPSLVVLYAKDFANVPGKLELTIRLARIMLPFLTLATIAAAAMGMLNALHHYFVPALSPAAFNVATIVCAVALVPLMPAIGLPRITAIAIGTILGGVAQIALQWPALAREGFRFRPSLDWRDPALRRVLLLMGPGTLGLAATQVNLFVSTLLATREGTGAVSWLQYAFRLMYLPIGLFGVSIATAVLPAAARHAAAADRAAIARTVTRGVALMLFVNIPATAGLIALAHEIVRLLFERGRFLPSDTAATAVALQCYAIGLIGYSTARIASPVFYALGQSRVPVLLSTVSIGVNILLSLTLVSRVGFRGLALATALAALVNGAGSLILLRKRLGALDERRLAATFGKTVVAALGMTAVVLIIVHALSTIAPAGGTALEAARVAVAIGGGLFALAIGAKLLRISEFDEMVEELRGRVQKLL
jgi:putative peptidoglycan lipid II flippase